MTNATPAPDFSVRILGGVEVVAGGRTLDLGGRKPAALLALLVLHANEGLSTDRLIDELWGEEPPRTARKSLQVHISRLRRQLGDGVLETRPQGYAVRLERAQVDAFRFDDLVQRARAAFERDDAGEAAAVLREALALWRGPPLAGLEGEPFARPAAMRLEESRLAAIELRIEIDLALGRQAGLVGELEQLISEHPFREGLRRQLMLALYRSGRQADALAAYRSARKVLTQELGVEPGRELRELEAAVLRQDPALSAPVLRGRPAARPRPRLLIAVVAAALGVASLVAVARLTEDSPPAAPAAPAAVADSVVKIDPRSNEIVHVTKVGREPEQVAIGAGAVWVVNQRDRTVSRLDRSGAVETIGGVAYADHLAVDGENVWVSSFDHSSVSRIDARTGEVVGSIGVSSRHAEGLAVGGGYLWITNPATVRGEGTETVSRVELRSGEVVSRIPVGKTPIFATFGYGSVWVANYDDDTISVVSPGSREAETVPVGDGPLGIATGFGAVWVVCFWNQELVRVDARTRRIAARIPIGLAPLDVSAGAGGVWVTNRESGTVMRVDPRSNKVAATIQLPATLSPRSVAAREGGVWVSVQRCSRPHCI